MTPNLSSIREKIASINFLEWKPFIEYNNKSVVTYNGVIFISKSDVNINDNPILGNNWIQLI